MNYYPEQLEQIAKFCRALNAVDDSDNEGKVSISNRIPVVDTEGDGSDVLGYLVDEIGGVWSFEPITGGV